jgi:hypothetical protein
VFAEFAKTLTGLKEPRYGAIDVHVLHKDGRMESKIVCFRWSPDSSKVGDKMKYAGSEGGFKGKTQAAKMLQANDAADVTLDVFVKFVRPPRPHRFLLLSTCSLPAAVLCGLARPLLQAFN